MEHFDWDAHKDAIKKLTDESIFGDDFDPELWQGVLDEPYG